MTERDHPNGMMPYHRPPALSRDALRFFTHANCQHCRGSRQCWEFLPPVPQCQALRQLIMAACADLPIPLETRMFLYPDIMDALDAIGSKLPKTCPVQVPFTI